MCLSGEVSDNWPPLIELIIFILFGGFDVGAHYGVYLVSKTKLIDLTVNSIRNVSTNANGTSLLNSTFSQPQNDMLFARPSDTISQQNVTSPNVNNTVVNASLSTITNLSINSFMNVTVTPEEQWEELIEFRSLFFYLWILGAIIFAIQVLWLVPNAVKHLLEADVAVLKDDSAHWYFRSVFPVHILLLILGTVLFDVPIACLTMEMLSIIWSAENVGLSMDQKLEVSKLIVTLTLLGLAFIALYKGMMPIFLWIGNPFCFPCIPLRLFIVMPGGLVAMVMTFAPPMGVAKYGLLSHAPPEMQAELSDLAGTFFQIGLIVWGLFFIVVFLVTCCYCKFCRE